MMTRNSRVRLLNKLKEIKTLFSPKSQLPYVNQHTDSGCGPIVLLNLLRWAGFDVNIPQHYPLLKYLTKADDIDSHGEFGVWPHDLMQAIQELCSTFSELEYVTCLKQPKVQDLLKQCHQGRAVLLHYRHPKPHSSHYVFIPSHELGEPIPIANEDNKSTVSHRYLKTLLSRQEPNKRQIDLEIDNIYPKAWVIGKSS